MKGRWGKPVRGALALLAAALLAAPQLVFADQQSVDNDLASTGNQNVVSLTAVAGATVNTSAQIVIERSGNNHLDAGSTVTLVDAGGGQTSLPAGYSVEPVTLTVPSPWNSNGQTVAGMSTISFTAPAAPGSYSYTAKWVASENLGNRLTGAPALVIHLAVTPSTPGDVTPPTITPNVSGTLGTGGWYTSDVTVGWTVSDPESAVTSSSGCQSTTISADTAGITLTCTATSAGGTASQSVTIKRDATKPAITISYPAEGATYLVNQIQPSYSVTDATSGVASRTASGFDVSFVGSKTFTVAATDNAGNSDSKSVSYRVTYGVKLLYDPLKAAKSGSTIPIKIQLVDANGANLSSSSIAVTALGEVSDSGKANPGNAFRYDSSLGGYIYNLSTKGLSAGDYELSFSVAGDPVSHSVPYRVR